MNRGDDGAGGWGKPSGGGGGGGGGSGFESGQAPSPVLPGPAQLMAFPQEYFPPSGAIDFNPNGFNAGQIVANGVVVLASAQLPASNRGVIRSVQFGVGGFTAAGAVLFQIRIAGMPAPGWGAIIVPPQAATFVSISFGPDETRIDVAAGKLIELTGQITAGGPFDMYAAAHGWSWGAL